MTGYGFCGPMTATGTTFDDKEESEFVPSTSNMLLMGAGSWILWILLR